MEALFPLFIFGAVIIMIIGGIAWAHFAEKKRKEALGVAADEFGLSFLPDGDGALESRLGSFSLFGQGRKRKLTNLIKGDTDEVEIALFDYQYTTGSGKHQHTHKQSVAALHSTELQCPHFTMRPEGMFDKIGSAIGFQDIDFDSHPEFSKMFVLKGEEAQVRSFFVPSVLEFFEQHKGISVEARPGALIFYRSGKRVKPEQLKDLLSDAYQVFGAIADAEPKEKA